MIGLIGKGDYSKTKNFLNRLLRRDFLSDLDNYGEMGVDALASATPVDTGLTADSWRYRVITDRNRPGIEWYNTNEVNGTSVAILIQYGHGTGTGGYVLGRDYINPAIRPVFEHIANDIWEKVKA